MWNSSSGDARNRGRLEEINFQTEGTKNAAGNHRERLWPSIGMVGSGEKSVLEIA